MTYKCTICGYIYEGTQAPETCPICDAPREAFELESNLSESKKDINGYKCLNCEYIEEGVEPPSTCPVCGVSSEYFEPVEAEAISSREMDYKNVVILGSGIAALSAAETMRRINDKVDITIITNEDRLTYYRLNLTRYLCGEMAEGDLCIHDQYWYDKQRYKVYRNRVVVDIDRTNQVVLTGDGLSVSYDKLLVAVGAHPFLPPIKGYNQSGVYSIRTIEDANAIKRLIEEGSKVLIIGGGVLGLEAAGALSQLGAAVTIAEGHEWLMPRQLNKKAATYVERDLKSKNIQIEYDFKTMEIIKSKEQFNVISKDGRSVECDVVIMATGVRSNTYIARKAELEVNRGVVVNDYMETSDPLIYAAGDICEHYGITYGLWNVAQYQGKIAAMNMLGIATAFGGVPRSNVLKVLDVDVFSIGEIQAHDGGYELIEKVDLDRYIMFLIKDNRVVGSIAIGYYKESYKIKELVEAESHVHRPTIDSLLDLIV